MSKRFSEPDLNQKRLQHQLQVQSKQIERVFSSHSVPATVAGGMVEPRSVRFDVQTQLNSGWERLKNVKTDLKQALGVNDVALQQQGEQVQVQVERPYDPPVALLDLINLVEDIPPGTAVLGLAEDGRPVLLNFLNKEITHILITGSERAGKTELMRTIAASLAFQNRQSTLQLILLDPLRSGPVVNNSTSVLQPLNYLPHMLADIGQKMADILELLDFLTNELQYRLQEKINTPHIVVLVDQADCLVERGGKPVNDAIRKLLQRGQQAGIHLVISMRGKTIPTPTSAWLKYLPMHIVGKIGQDETIAESDASHQTEAENLLGEGDFIATMGRSKTHFQAAYIGDYDLHMGLQNLLKSRPILLAHSISEKTTPKPEPEPEPEPEQRSRISTAEKPLLSNKGVVTLGDSS